MSWQGTAWAAAQDVPNPATKLTLMMIANNHHNHHDECVVSEERLAAETGQSVRTIRTQIKRLKELGLLKTERIFTSNGQRAGTDYILVGLTKLTDEEVRARARRYLPTPKRQDLPVGGSEEPTGNMLPVGGGGLPEKSPDPTGKNGGPYRQTVAGPYIDSRIPGDTGSESEIGERRAREIWRAAGATLRAEIGEATWKSWIEPLRIVSLDPPILEAPSRFFADRVRVEFAERLERLLGRGRVEILTRAQAHAVREDRGRKAGKAAE